MDYERKYIEIITRDLHKNKEKLKELYKIDMTNEEKIDVSSKDFLSDAFDYAETKLRNLGISQENAFFYIFGNNVDLRELHKKHVIMQSYIFLKRNTAATKSLSDYMNDFNDNGSASGGALNYIVTNYSKKFQNNLLNRFFFVEKDKKVNVNRFKVTDYYGLLFKELCQNADKGPFYQYDKTNNKSNTDSVISKLDDLLTMWKEDDINYFCKNAYNLYSEISSLNKCDSQGKYDTKLTYIQKRAKHITQVYTKNIDFFTKLKDMCVQCEELRFIEDIYNQAQSISSDKIYIYFSAMLKYVNKFPISLINSKENYFKKIIESDIKKLRQKKKNNDTKLENIKVNKYTDKLKILTVFQRDYFKKIYELSYDEAKKVDTLSMHYMTEQMLNYTTIMYIIQVIEEHNLEHQVDDILKSMVYIFTVPNIYIRKYYIDTLLQFYINTGKMVLGGYHEAKMQMHSTDKKYINTNVKRFLLNMSLTYIPMLEVCFYNVLWNSFDASEEFRKKEILKTLEKSLYNQKYEEYDLYTLAQENKFSFEEGKDLFMKIYNAILKYLYNEVQLEKWEKGLNINYLESDEYIKLMVSMLEFERTNIFDSKIADKYFPGYVES